MEPAAFLFSPLCINILLQTQDIFRLFCFLLSSPSIINPYCSIRCVLTFCCGHQTSSLAAQIILLSTFNSRSIISKIQLYRQGWIFFLYRHRIFGKTFRFLFTCQGNCNTFVTFIFDFSTAWILVSQYPDVRRKHILFRQILFSFDIIRASFR